MNPARIAALLLLPGLLPLSTAWAQARVASFRVDATPPLGQPLIWVKPVERVEDPLWAKGVVIEQGAERYVLCALDWCGISGSTEEALRVSLAKGAGTSPAKVALHTVHQHTAPYVDGDAFAVLAAFPNPPLRTSAAFLEELGRRLGEAAKQARGRLEPFDRVGTGEARIERVASIRRLPAPGGKVATRYSSSGKDPAMAAAPEGPVDPMLRTVTLAAGGRPLVRLHYYATHPQTFCCEGTVTADFVGTAREQLERREGVPQIYFTGAAGDVTVGKYNDGSREARAGLAQRLLAGMQASSAATRLEPAGKLVWRSVETALPVRPASRAGFAKAKHANDDQRYRAAIQVAFAERRRPLGFRSLEIGRVSILHLPGEPMLEFQKFAQKLQPGRFVAVAGYGDLQPGYICTDRAHEEGGYEPSATNAAPGAEAVFKKTIRQLLGIRTE